MNFLLYYILRRFFVRLEVTHEKIVLTKGFFFKITAIIPRLSVIKITVKQTPFLRLFRAKEVTLFTQNGKITFFLAKNEKVPFLPEMPEICIKPRFSEIAFGAFIDARALAGIAFFAIVLRKIGKIFGSSYFDGIISALFSTAEKISDALLVVHVAVPKIAAFAAVFAVCAWIFTFIVKFLRLSAMRVSRRGEYVFVKSGIVTLYETALVRNTAAVIRRKTVICQLFGRSPVYYHDTLIFPAVSERNSERILARFFGIAPEPSALLKTPFRKILGHCTVPLWILCVSSALLAVVYLSPLSSAELLKTALLCAIFASGYNVFCGVFLMSRAVSTLGEHTITLSFRKETAVFCACFPTNIARGYVLSQNIFQCPADLCDCKIFVIGRKSFKARQLPMKHRPVSEQRL